MGKLWKKITSISHRNVDQNYVVSAVLDFGDLGKHRFHLRFLNDGRGLLNIDAKHIIFLNSTARIYLDLFIKGKNTSQIQKYMTRRFSNVDKATISKDLSDIMNQIRMILSEKGHCPIHDIGLKPTLPPTDLGFPLRVDFALTYRCNNKCAHCYVPGDILNNFPNELSTEDVKKTMDILWSQGVPHIALTGGEVSLRSDLLDIVDYGQSKGFVMGIITNGRKFADDNFVSDVVKRGLDYVQITIESHDANIHDQMQGIDGAWQQTTQAIKNFVNSGIFVLTNTTISKTNIASIEETVKFLKRLGLEAFAMNGLIYSGEGALLQRQKDAFLHEDELAPVLDRILSVADDVGLRFIWYSPTQYCVFNPMEYGLGSKRCSAANMSIGVQPNGDVIPCQSYFKPVGNLLTDDWKSIWNSKLFRNIREHKLIEKKCLGCEMLDLCGGGCPLYISEKNQNVGHVVPI